MPKEEEKEYLKILGVDKCSPENEFEIKRAYKKLALQFHPDKNQSDFSASNSKKQFDEISKAFESLTLEYRNDSNRPDYDQIFFDFLRDIFDWKEDAEGAGTSNFLTYFCSSKQHPCSSDGDFESRYPDTEEDEDIDGEGDLDSIMEIIKNRKKKGKPVPEEFKEENLMGMKNKLNQHKEDMKRDATKKQSSKKGKMPVPVAKPKPKSKKQLQAEQRRREKEMEKIAVELEEKRKEEEEKEKQRKQLEVEKQKRLEEERIKAQNEERKRREKEQKERERQQKLEQEKEEKRRRQQEEEKKRREEEEKRKKAEKEKAEKEKAARKAAQQAAKEKEDKEKAANKNQSMKRLQQQQRTDQQQYPREIPPRFQKKLKQQQQQSQYQMTSQQMQQQQSLPQQTKPQPKQPPAVGKKKDPNRFGAKEFADMIDPVDDSGWSQSAPVKGSGWGNSLETWEDADKWGSEDRQWGDKEGTWDKLVVDGGDKDTWPNVGSKGAIGEKIKTSSLDAGSEKGQYSAESSPKTSVSSLSNALILDNSNSTQGNVNANMDKKSLETSNWPGTSTTSSENWDVIDESIDQAIDAAEAATAKDNGGLEAGWGAVAKGGFGGLMGNSSSWENSLIAKDSVSLGHSHDTGKGEFVNTSHVSENPSWNKTPGKGVKPKVPTTSTVVTSNLTTSWGGTPAETNTKWTEPHATADGLSNSKSSKPPLLDSNSISKSTGDDKCEQTVTSNSGTKPSSGWGEVPASNSSKWGSSADITGTSCWDSVVSKSDTTSDLKTVSSSKVSQWLESTGVSLADLEWGQENVDNDEGSEGSLDGWTTASKRNRAPKPANDSNAWMNRSLKQLLDMGFKQEDAEKALKANHMNIESAIGDLLAMNMNENREQSVSVPPGKLQEPDPAEAARIQQQQQQQCQGKLNRKQRRKLQQQQQAEQQTLESKTEQKQGQNEVTVSKSVTQTNESVPKPASEQQNKTSETQSTTKAEDAQQDSKTKVSTTSTKTEKPPLSVTGAAKPTNGQLQLPSNGKRTGPPLVPPAQNPGVQGPLRPTLAHPLLHPQFVQQFHLQQLRMAQGGLLQSPFTPQQIAMLQQIAQLQLVQQRLAAQSVAQQHLGQKQQVVPQQQLYQQQQQIALMIAQMQQQVLQQQPGLAGRHPALPFTAVQQQQQQSLLQQQQQQQSLNAQQKGNKATANDKPTTEAPTSKITDNVKSQPSEPSAVPPVTTEEQPKQPSPVTQSRLTQWKQPLLHEPSSASVTQSSVTSSTSASVDSKPQTISAPSQSSSGVPASVVSAPSISTSDLSDSSAPNSNNVSPRARIPDPVSSRWGVDAGPKLSADPPEFKPGVPWRPAPKSDKREEVRDSVSPNTVESTSRPSSTIDSSSDSWSNLGNQTVSAPSSIQLGSNVKIADNVVSTTANSSFSGMSTNNNTFESSQIDFGLGSTPWQDNLKAPAPPPQGTSRSAGSSAASLLRPPPGLGSDTTLPESPLFDEEPPAWLKSLIDGSSLGGDKTQPEFQFSRFGFANSSTPWSARDSSTQPFSPLTPNPQPWAAVGGPAPTLSSSASAVTIATSESRSGSVSTTEPSSLQNSGIIWSTNQPIPSAEEKLPGSLPGTSVPPVSVSSGVAPFRNAVSSMSTWLVLRNLSPRMDPKTLRPMCERHGPLLTFQLNLRHGNSLIRYGSMEEAAKARAVLNGMILGGSQVAADFATDSDIGSFFEQTMDWSANPFPSNTYGNQWSFQNVLGSAVTSDNIQSTTKAPIGKVLPGVPSTEQPAPKVNNPPHGMQWGSTIGTLPSPSQGLVIGEQSKVNAPSPQWAIGPQGSEQPGAKSNTAAPSVPWGSVPGHAPAPSYLWGSGPSQQTALGGNFSQVPSMWSFPAGVQRDVEPQSGSGDGLVSPSMTTFLPPGLLNGGGDSV